MGDEESDTSGVVGAGEGAKVMLAPSEGRHGSAAVGDVVDMLACDGACAEGMSHGDIGCRCGGRYQPWE